MGGLEITICDFKSKVADCDLKKKGFYEELNTAGSS